MVTGVGINLKMGYSSWRIPLGSGIPISKGVSEDKIRVIGPGIDLETLSQGNPSGFQEKHGLRRPFILFLGTVSLDIMGG